MMNKVAASALFTPLTVREIRFRNRIAVSPMCQYSATDGFANDWHFVHLGSRAVGGAGFVCVEATAVEPRGRISPADMGLWSDAHGEPLARIARFIRAQGAIAGIQLAHAGRKASTDAPWRGGAPLTDAQGGWTPIAPSAIPFSSHHRVPDAMDSAAIHDVLEAFTEAARRARDAGFQVIEIHSAHGYLIHEFLSPLANRRTDGYGGEFANRTRLLRETVHAVRRVWPKDLPLLVRISATDWADGGWTVDDSVALARELAGLGVDLIDCSSGGMVPDARVPLGPGYQVPFAARIRREAGILTGAVGLITEPEQAESIIRDGAADLTFLARQLLRDPYWPVRAAKELGADPPIVPQYARAH